MSSALFDRSPGERRVALKILIAIVEHALRVKGAAAVSARPAVGRPSMG